MGVFLLRFLKGFEGVWVDFLFFDKEGLRLIFRSVTAISLKSVS